MAGVDRAAVARRRVGGIGAVCRDDIRSVNRAAVAFGTVAGEDRVAQHTGIRAGPEHVDRAAVARVAGTLDRLIPRERAVGHIDRRAVNRAADVRCVAAERVAGARYRHGINRAAACVRGRVAAVDVAGRNDGVATKRAALSAVAGEVGIAHGQGCAAHRVDGAAKRRVVAHETAAGNRQVGRGPDRAAVVVGVVEGEFAAGNREIRAGVVDRAAAPLAVAAFDVVALKEAAVNRQVERTGVDRAAVGRAVADKVAVNDGHRLGGSQTRGDTDRRAVFGGRNVLEQESVERDVGRRGHAEDPVRFRLERDMLVAVDRQAVVIDRVSPGAESIAGAENERGRIGHVRRVDPHPAET